MRRLAWTLPCVWLGLLVTGPVDAKPLLDVTGRVALLDGVVPSGVRVTLGLDLDRDGTLNSFELVEGTVGADGSYAVNYTPDPSKVDFEFVKFVAQLALDYEARGFEAVLDDGPLPIIVKFEREGYSTIVKRFTTLSDLPSLDIVLAPLAPIACAGMDCMAPDGSVHVSGFPGGTGIQRAYTRRYDPSLDRSKFPGSFTDTAQNLLISSGFTEVDLRDASGKHVSKLSSPVTVRFQTDPTSWPNLRDLSPDSGRIEVPMYSFDETRGDWVSEPRGELQDGDGGPIDEADFSSIQDGSYPDPVFVSFDTAHFSTFNCDAPNTKRGCVQGRLVTLTGEAVVGVQVSVEGVNYTGSAGTVFTGDDGAFASDLMKSELPNEDTDGNGKKGDTFQARVTASGAVGVFVGEAFDTPTEQGTVGAAKSCRPPACDCIDLGDVVGDFELPRACEITVHATFSGKNLSGSGPVAKGDDLVGANVTAEISGGPSLPLDDAICGGAPCGSGKSGDDGTTTFIVPVVGDSPQIQVKADLQLSMGGNIHYYTGGATVTGCSRKQDALTADVEVTTEHASLGDLADVIKSLGVGPPPPSDSPVPSLGIEPPKAPQAPHCACRQAAVDGTARGPGLGLVAGLLGLAFARCSAAGRRPSERGASKRRQSS